MDNRANIGVECDVKPGTAGKSAMPRSLGGEVASSRKGDLCLSRVLPPSVDKSNIWSRVPFQVADAEDTSPLKIGTMWRPPSEPMLKISAIV